MQHLSDTHFPRARDIRVQVEITQIQVGGQAVAVAVQLQLVQHRTLLQQGKVVQVEMARSQHGYRMTL
jgi:hypothetical protein